VAEGYHPRATRQKHEKKRVARGASWKRLKRKGKQKKGAFEGWKVERNFKNGGRSDERRREQGRGWRGWSRKFTTHDKHSLAILSSLLLVFIVLVFGNLRRDSNRLIVRERKHRGRVYRSGREIKE